MEITKIDDNNFVADGVHYEAFTQKGCDDCHLVDNEDFCYSLGSKDIFCEMRRKDSRAVIWLKKEAPPKNIVSPQNPPPAGLVPEYIYDATVASSRTKDIVAAMQRYIEKEKPIPVEWAQELVRRLS